MDKRRLRGLIWSAELIVFLALSSQIVIPLPVVPLTVQTLAVGLMASVVDFRIASWTILGYLLLGSIGLPVFAGGASGVGVLFGPEGGYIVGFFLQAWIVVELRRNVRIGFLVLGNLVGALVQLIFGTIWLKFFGNLDWSAAMVGGLIPFLIPAIIKAVLAAGLARAILIKLKRPLGMVSDSE